MTQQPLPLSGKRPLRPSLALSGSLMTAISLLLIAASGAGADTPQLPTRSGSLPQGGQCHLDLCRVLAIDDVEVPALEDGPLVAVLTQDGDLVQKGALLAQVGDRLAQLERRAAEKELEAAVTRAEDDISVRAAEAEFETADAELQQGLALNSKRRNTIAASEIRRRRLARYRAQLGIDKSRLDLKVAKMGAEMKRASLEVADERVQRRRIVSPVDGIVMPLYRGTENQRVCQVGQWVRAGESVLRVIRMDRLYVEGLVSASHYNPSDLDGRPVRVTVQLAGGRTEQFSGNVVYITPTISKQNKYRVRAEVTNRTENGQPLLRPGSTTQMTIHLH